MSSRIIAICDVCQREQEIKASLPLNSAEWEHELALEGWWQRPDFREICPNHPLTIANPGSPREPQTTHEPHCDPVYGCMCTCDDCEGLEGECACPECIERGALCPDCVNVGTITKFAERVAGWVPLTERYDGAYRSAGGRIAKCPSCGKLVIYGQTCTCGEVSR